MDLMLPEVRWVLKKKSGFNFIEQLFLMIFGFMNIVSAYSVSRISLWNFFYLKLRWLEVILAPPEESNHSNEKT